MVCTVSSHSVFLSSSSAAVSASWLLAQQDPGRNFPADNHPTRTQAAWMRDRVRQPQHFLPLRKAHAPFGKPGVEGEMGISEAAAFGTSQQCEFDSSDTSTQLKALASCRWPAKSLPAKLMPRRLSSGPIQEVTNCCLDICAFLSSIYHHHNHVEKRSDTSR